MRLPCSCSAGFCGVTNTSFSPHFILMVKKSVPLLGGVFYGLLSSGIYSGGMFISHTQWHWRQKFPEWPQGCHNIQVWHIQAVVGGWGMLGSVLAGIYWGNGVDIPCFAVIYVRLGSHLGLLVWMVSFVMWAPLWIVLKNCWNSLFLVFINYCWKL